MPSCVYVRVDMTCEPKVNAHTGIVSFGSSFGEFKDGILLVINIWFIVSMYCPVAVLYVVCKFCCWYGGFQVGSKFMRENWAQVGSGFLRVLPRMLTMFVRELNMNELIQFIVSGEWGLWFCQEHRVNDDFWSVMVALMHGNGDVNRGSNLHLMMLIDVTLSTDQMSLDTFIQVLHLLFESASQDSSPQ
uniref:Uncharacterized protein n=1 Tax=Tanacetum cinerariifolium TaxID=118510 RepID=A0A6L2LRP3_TANCI|nr:hypothetical protein [Tanacetum cinerariifolium]